MTTAAYCEIRPYRRADASETFAVFQEAVTVTVSKDYTPEQLDAWSGDEHRNLTDWDQARSNRRTFVACIEGEIVGFTDVGHDGFIDMMFVSPRYGRQGSATGST